MADGLTKSFKWAETASRPAGCTTGRDDSPTIAICARQMTTSLNSTMRRRAFDDGLSAPDSKAGKLQRACLALLHQHEREGTIPTNGRFLFYELEQQGVVPKHYVKPSGEKRARTPAQNISDATMWLRELDLVPRWWIEDESRDVRVPRYAASVYKYVVDTVSLACIDCWDGELPPLIICEARATRGVLERIKDEYCCP